MSSCSQTTALTNSEFSARRATLGIKRCRSFNVHAGVDMPSNRDIKPKERCFLGLRDVGEEVSCEQGSIGCCAGMVELALVLLQDPTGRILPARASYLFLRTEALVILTSPDETLALGLSGFLTLSRAAPCVAGELVLTAFV